MLEPAKRWTLYIAEETLPLFFRNYGDKSYKSNSTILYGTQVKNSAP
jgi:hypothetical protein